MSTTPVSAISRATCLNHPQREAAAKCVACGKSFCRECVTPVDRRMFCAPCYRSATGPKEGRKRDWFVLSVGVQAFLGLMGIWFTAYFLGRVLLELPSAFHEGTVWESLTSGG